FQRYVGTVDDATEMQNRWFFYGQDTWRVSPKLVVNYGLRWDIYRPQYVNGPGKGANVDPATGEALVAGANGISMSMNTSIPPRTLAPRAGIAYKLTDGTVIRAGYGRGFHLGIFGSIFGHNVTQNLPVLAIQNLNPANSFQSVFTLAQGPSAVADPAAILAARPKGPGGHPMQPDGFRTQILPATQRVPTVDTWNITLQRQVNSTMSVEAAYVGTKGTHEPPGYNYGYDLNDATLVGFASGLSTNQRRALFGRYGWTQLVRYSGNDSSNRYHSLQTKVDKRFAKGLLLQGHYTWSRALDFDSAQYIYRRDLGFGPNNANRNHILQAMGLWEIPVGRGRRALNNIPGALNLVIGGWQANFVHMWRTGILFTPSYQNCNSDQDVGVCRPHVV
ncbi:MAG: TonB-dependent receptor domain-containing protein, partial [Gammaproteobacteria bacterium]